MSFPELDASNFAVRISEKAEFANTRYVAPLDFSDLQDNNDNDNDNDNDTKTHNDMFRMHPHQFFGLNYLHPRTGYNSIILNHGLGSGKTYSAALITEMMRAYYDNLLEKPPVYQSFSVNDEKNQPVEIKPKPGIIIVASSLVRENFKHQLNNLISKKLRLQPEYQHLSEDVVHKKTQHRAEEIIAKSYWFLGYQQFSSIILAVCGERNCEKLTITDRIRLGYIFGKRTIVIDEVHNMRALTINKKIISNRGKAMAILTNAVPYIKYIFLSATLVYNDPREIVAVANYMLCNDRRTILDSSEVVDDNNKIKESAIFTSSGQLRDDTARKQLKRALTGYISFVRGENPHTFPFRVYPIHFAPEKSLLAIKYPMYTLNGKYFNPSYQSHLDLFVHTLTLCTKRDCDCQRCTYTALVEMFNYQSKSFSGTDTFKHDTLRSLMKALVITYPIAGDKITANQTPIKFSKNKVIGNVYEVNEETEAEIEADSDSDNDLEDAVKNSHAQTNNLSKIINTATNLETVVEKKKSNKYAYAYRKKYQNFFQYNQIGKYSAKIKSILEQTGVVSSSTKTTLIPDGTAYDDAGSESDNDYANQDDFYDSDDDVSGESDDDAKSVADGICLIHAKHYDEILALAFALEEAGMNRVNEDPKKAENLLVKKESNKKVYNYTILSANVHFTKDSNRTVQLINRSDNKNGDLIKIILATDVAAEGIDFTGIRQIHQLNGWYNLNHIEQINGRGVRTNSHAHLDVLHRNCQLFLHATQLEIIPDPDDTTPTRQTSNKQHAECADLFIYRYAEQKARNIGAVTRVIKECAIDCFLNHDQTHFSQEYLQMQMQSKQIQTEVNQKLSNGSEVTLKIGDEPYSFACDYMDSCIWKCDSETGGVDTASSNNNNNKNNDQTSPNFGSDGTTNTVVPMRAIDDWIILNIIGLFKTQLFYTFDVIFNELSDNGDTPLYSKVQVYAALTKIIDNQIKLTDMFGRSGTLANVHQYYLFRPKNLSVSSESESVHQIVSYEKPNLTVKLK